MAVSFVIRFRRQLSVIPFVIVLVIPAMLVTWFWFGRQPLDAPVDVGGEMICISADASANPTVDNCNFNADIPAAELASP